MSFLHPLLVMCVCLPGDMAAPSLQDHYIAKKYPRDIHVFPHPKQRDIHISPVPSDIHVPVIHYHLGLRKGIDFQSCQAQSHLQFKLELN